MWLSSHIQVPSPPTHTHTHTHAYSWCVVCCIDLHFFEMWLHTNIVLMCRSYIYIHIYIYIYGFICIQSLRFPDQVEIYSCCIISVQGYSNRLLLRKIQQPGMLATYYRQTTDIDIWIDGHQLHQDWYDTNLANCLKAWSHSLNQCWPTISDSRPRARLKLVPNIQGANELMQIFHNRPATMYGVPMLFTFWLKGRVGTKSDL